MATATMTARELLTTAFQGEQVSCSHASRLAGARQLTLTFVARPLGGQTLTPELLSCEKDFETHLRRYPDDTNFVAQRNPGRDYGQVPLCPPRRCQPPG